MRRTPDGNPNTDANTPISSVLVLKINITAHRIPHTHSAPPPGVVSVRHVRMCVLLSCFADTTHRGARIPPNPHVRIARKVGLFLIARHETFYSWSINTNTCEFSLLERRPLCGLANVERTIRVPLRSRRAIERGLHFACSCYLVAPFSAAERRLRGAVVGNCKLAPRK